MLGYNYTKRHSEVLRYNHTILYNKYGFKNSMRPRSHSVQDVVIEIRIGTQIKIIINILYLFMIKYDY